MRAFGRLRTPLSTTRMLNMTVQPIAAQGTQDQAAQAQEQDNLWVPDGTAHTWGFAGETMEIAVSNEGSRIDLNQAPRELLVGLFTAAQVPDDEVNALADAVIDWRDPDDLRSADGAEDSDYEAAGRPYGAKDGPFDSVEELQQVLGFTHQLYRVLEPALTVATGSAQVVQDLASPLVIAALQGISEEEARDRQQEQQAAEGVPGAAGSTVASLNRGGPLYRIRVTLHQGRGASPSMEVLVRAAVEGGGGTPRHASTSLERRAFPCPVAPLRAAAASERARILRTLHRDRLPSMVISGIPQL